MKYIFYIILGCLAFTSPKLAGQDQQEIFGLLIEKYLDKRFDLGDEERSTPIFLTEPRYFEQLDSSDFSRFKNKLKHLQEDTFQSFVSANAVDFDTLPVVRSSIELYIVDSITISVSELASEYQRWNTLIGEASNIGISQNGCQALLYFGYTSGKVTGGGVYILLRKRKRGWKVWLTTPAWSS